MAEKKLFGFGKRDLLHEHHWQELDFDSYKFRKDGATLFCLEGNGTTDFSKINAGCKRNETLMGIKIEQSQDVNSSYKDVDIVGVYYPMLDGRTVGEISTEGYKVLVNKFMTLCEGKDGLLLPQEEIKKNFSRLVISSHCYGAIVIDRIFSGIKNNLQKHGLSTKEILDIFAQTAHVSYAPHTDSTHLPIVRVESFTDSVHRGLPGIYKQHYGETLDGIKIYHNKAQNLNNGPSPFALQESIQVFSSRLINTTENTNLRELKDEHEAHYLIRDEKWRSAPKFKGCLLSEHAVNLDVTSQMMGYALAMFTANAIANANSEELIEKPSLEMLTDHLQSILESVPQEDLKAKQVQEEDGPSLCR